MRDPLEKTIKPVIRIDETLAQRGGRYGSAIDNAYLTMDLYDAVQRAPSFKEWTPMHKLMVHMILHKISRMANGDPMYVDNAHDIVGYGKLLEDYLVKIESGEEVPCK